MIDREEPSKSGPDYLRFRAVKLLLVVLHELFLARHANEVVSTKCRWYDNHKK